MDSDYMAEIKKKTNPPLDARFKFAEDSFARLSGGRDSHLRPVVSVADGEPYLLRLFKRTGAALDTDLRVIVGRGLRRIRFVLSSRRARDVLVEVLDTAEDQHDLAIVKADLGSPISGASQRRPKREGRYLTSASRGVLWRNMCHDPGIMHGGVSLHSIVSVAAR